MALNREYFNRKCPLSATKMCWKSQTWYHFHNPGANVLILIVVAIQSFAYKQANRFPTFVPLSTNPGLCCV